MEEVMKELKEEEVKSCLKDVRRYRIKFYSLILVLMLLIFVFVYVFWIIPGAANSYFYYRIFAFVFLIPVYPLISKIMKVDFVGRLAYRHYIRAKEFSFYEDS